MWLGDPNIPIADKQDWVWKEIACRHPEFKRENFPIDDPHTLHGMIVDNVCKFIPKHGDIVMDVGANCGIFTTMCAMRGGIVWAFEPHTVAVQFMHEALRRNNVSERVVVSTAAIWISTGTVKFGGATSMSDGWISCNGMTGDGDHMVPAISFHDALLLNPQWDCVKMDIEGAEFDVLLATSEEDLRKIKFLTLELHHNAEEEGKYGPLMGKLESMFSIVGHKWEGKYSHLQGTRK